ncbi:MAG: hypothetical protein RL490_2539, partial [Pseudomonadota bacterium]
MDNTPPTAWSFPTRFREDGWTPEAMEGFIIG